MPSPFDSKLDAKACGLISAALRHLRDADTLLGAADGRNSPEGAYYLAGYAVELAGKATLAQRWLDQAIGHVDAALHELGSQVRLLAFDLDPVARRYTDGGIPQSSELARWSTDVRYKKTGSISAVQAKALLEEARGITDEIVLGMWADGRFPTESPIW